MFNVGFIYLNCIFLEDVCQSGNVVYLSQCNPGIHSPDTNRLLSLKVEHNLPAGKNNSVLNVLGVALC